MIKRKSLFVVTGLLAVALYGIVVVASLLPSGTSDVVEGNMASASISGPYYVVAETTIIGPRVNLALVQEKHGGTLGPDYVQFSSYRIYIDNTFQKLVADSSLNGVSNKLEQTSDDRADLENTFNGLVSSGAIHASSYLSSAMVMKGTPSSGWWTMWYNTGSDVIMFQTTDLKGILFHYYTGSSSAWAKLYLNGELFLSASGRYDIWKYGWDVPYASGSFEFYLDTYAVSWIRVTIYTKDAPSVSMQPTEQTHVLSASGVGYSWKVLNPGSVDPGENLQVISTHDTPEATDINITEVFPADFDLVGDVLVEKYDQSGLVELAYVSVSTTTIFTREQFNLDYTDVAWLSSLETDEWIRVTFTINSVVSGTYTFTPSKINYTPVPSS